MTLRSLVTCWLATAFLDASGMASATMVRFDTSLGPIDIELLDADAPRTVANFLGYVRRGAYQNTIIHRAVTGFVIQGGGYAVPSLAHIATDPPVANEFSATRSNLRGTVAMAKLGSSPDSATSEWFVNLANNAANLDNQNGGFTVFGRVTATTMPVVDAIAALRRVNAAGCSASFSAFSDLPITGTVTACAQVVAANLVVMNSVRELPARASDTASDRIFNFLEAAYAAYATPASPASQTAFGYYYRYYSKTGGYLGTKDGNVYYLLPENNGVPVLIGTVAQWLATATEAGY
jgi:cyclophilin family peptidyl-prolyl cis-trans isomerase